MLIGKGQKARPVQRIAKGLGQARRVGTGACALEQRQPFWSQANVGSAIWRTFLQGDSAGRAKA
jgi:hypothetical protein